MKLAEVLQVIEPDPLFTVAVLIPVAAVTLQVCSTQVEPLGI